MKENQDDFEKYVTRNNSFVYLDSQSISRQRKRKLKILESFMRKEKEDRKEKTKKIKSGEETEDEKTRYFRS